MSYSRWGWGRGSGYWYTFWCVPSKDKPETRDNAIFEICMVLQLPAKEIRDDIDKCIERVAEIDTKATTVQLEELKTYMREFLVDVDREGIPVT